MITTCSNTCFEVAEAKFDIAKSGIQAIESHFVTPTGSQLVYVHNVEKDKKNLLLPFIALYKCLNCESVKLLFCQRWMVRILGKLIWESQKGGDDKANEMSMLTFLVRKQSKSKNVPTAEGDDNDGGGGGGGGDT
jgi:hypothetical protein